LCCKEILKKETRKKKVYKVDQKKKSFNKQTKMSQEFVPLAPEKNHDNNNNNHNNDDDDDENHQQRKDPSSLKARASSLWGELRNTVVQTSQQLKETIVMPVDRVVRYTKPICLQGRHCTMANDRIHMEHFRHPCPYGAQCGSKYYPSHANDFTHSTLHCEEALLIADPNDNKVKSAARENAIEGQSISTKGAFDFLEDITSSSNNTKKGNEMSVLGAIRDASSISGGAAMSTPWRPKNIAITRLSPMRCYYGEKEWHIWFYDQRAQWPLEGEVLTKEDMILTFGADSDIYGDFNRLRLYGNENDDDENNQPQQSQRHNNQAQTQSEVSAVDKAKAFFDDLFGAVKEKISPSENKNNRQAGAATHPPVDGAHRLPSNDQDQFGEEQSSLLGGNNNGEHREKEMDKGFW
jgi:hypothetical protein